MKTLVVSLDGLTDEEIIVVLNSGVSWFVGNDNTHAMKIVSEWYIRQYEKEEFSWWYRVLRFFGLKPKKMKSEKSEITLH